MKRRNDIILIISILLISLILFFFFSFNKAKGRIAYIYHNEEIIMRLDLNIDKEVKVTGDISDMIIIVNEGKIHVEYSGCSNQICVNEGEKEYENEVITCLPNHIIIKICEE